MSPSVTRIAVFLTVLALSACSRKSAVLVVGSKATIEQTILAEIIALHVEKKLGITVERKLNLGDTATAFTP